MARIEAYKRPIGVWPRMIIGMIATVLVPPFVVLAIAPMVLVLVPVAIVAIPFMLSAFATEARDVQPLPRRIREWSHAHG